MPLKPAPIVISVVVYQIPTYTEEQIIKILEIACRNPEEYGYEASHWCLEPAGGC